MLRSYGGLSLADNDTPLHPGSEQEEGASEGPTQGLQVQYVAHEVSRGGPITTRLGYRGSPGFHRGSSRREYPASGAGIAQDRYPESTVKVSFPLEHDGFFVEGLPPQGASSSSCDDHARKVATKSKKVSPKVPCGGLFQSIP